MYRAMRFLHSSAKNHHPQHKPEARGTVDGITRGKKAKKQVATAGRSREQEKRRNNLTLVSSTPLNYVVKK